MLVIKKEQIEIMASCQVERLINDCLCFTKEYWPEEYTDISEKEVKKKVRKVISKADGYGIKKEGLVLRFLNLIYALGPDFDLSKKNDWALKILTDKNLSDSEKIDQLEEETETILSE